jgi:hypothetical protein
MTIGCRSLFFFKMEKLKDGKTIFHIAPAGQNVSAGLYNPA